MTSEPPEGSKTFGSQDDRSATSQPEPEDGPPKISGDRQSAAEVAQTQGQHSDESEVPETGSTNNNGKRCDCGHDNSGPSFIGASSALIWVFAWICLAVWMAMGTLASNQFHNDLETLKQRGMAEPETTLVTLDQLVHLLHQLEDLNKSTGELRNELNSIEGRLRGVRAEKEKLLVALENLKNRKGELEERKSLLADQLLLAIPSQAFDLISEIEKTEKFLDEATDISKKLSIDIEGINKEIGELILSETEANAKLSVNKDESEDINNELSQSPELVRLATDQQRSSMLLLSIFFEMPKNIVILMLALAMGALGSTIQLSRSAFSGAGEYPVSWYVIRPFQGMVLSLAMYILIKSGQYAVIDPSGVDEDLNPFTISLLAIVSGLFSERAYERLQLASEAVLRPNGNAN